MRIDENPYAVHQAPLSDPPTIVEQVNIQWSIMDCVTIGLTGVFCAGLWAAIFMYGVLNVLRDSLSSQDPFEGYVRLFFILIYGLPQIILPASAMYIHFRSMKKWKIHRAQRTPSIQISISAETQS